MSALRPAVQAVFRSYSEKLEGRTRHPYADVKGLLTVSVGCIIDPIDLALTLPWMIGNRRASQNEIRTQWEALKARKDVWNWLASKQAALTTIRLTDEGVNALMARRLASSVAYLCKHTMPQFGSFPADAQLGIMSAAWGLGPGFQLLKPPRVALIQACNRGDWLAAKVHAHLSEANNAGVVERNRHQERCFDNATTVTERGLDPAVLWWPNKAPESTLKDEAAKAIALVADHQFDRKPERDA